MDWTPITIQYKCDVIGLEKSKRGINQPNALFAGEIALLPSSKKNMKSSRNLNITRFSWVNQMKSPYFMLRDEISLSSVANCCAGRRLHLQPLVLLPQVYRVWVVTRRAPQVGCGGRIQRDGLMIRAMDSMDESWDFSQRFDEIYSDVSNSAWISCVLQGI